jgi:hypothetical protein
MSSNWLSIKRLENVIAYALSDLQYGENTIAKNSNSSEVLSLPKISMSD